MLLRSLPLDQGGEVIHAARHGETSKPALDD